jgi:hypothetical protein
MNRPPGSRRVGRPRRGVGSPVKILEHITIPSLGIRIELEALRPQVTTDCLHESDWVRLTDCVNAGPRLGLPEDAAIYVSDASR